MITHGNPEFETADLLRAIRDLAACGRRRARASTIRFHLGEVESYAMHTDRPAIRKRAERALSWWEARSDSALPAPRDDQSAANVIAFPAPAVHLLKRLNNHEPV